MHKFNQTTSTAALRKVIGFLIIVAILGVATGFLLGNSKSGSGKHMLSLPQLGNSMQGKTFGSNDTTTFKDTAEGILQNGGIDGEGQYHLVRPGGDSQNVYMTSSSVDLSQFINKKIKVWGQTQAAKKAGWLMDIGRVQVLE